MKSERDYVEDLLLKKKHELFSLAEKLEDTELHLSAE